jgi:hypothetical protein
MLFYKGFWYSEEFQKILPARQKISGSLSAVRTIVPSLPDAHLSTVPSVRTTCLTVRTPDRPSIIRPEDVHFPSGPLLYREATVPALHLSGRLNSPSGRLSVIDQLQILSKFNLREDCFNCPDDMDSRPDALIHKARIAIQISPSGRQSALVRTVVLQLRKLPIQLQPSGWLPIMVRTRA